MKKLLLASCALALSINAYAIEDTKHEDTGLSAWTEDTAIISIAEPLRDHVKFDVNHYTIGDRCTLHYINDYEVKATCNTHSGSSSIGWFYLTNGGRVKFSNPVLVATYTQYLCNYRNPDGRKVGIYATCDFPNSLSSCSDNSVLAGLLSPPHEIFFEIRNAGPTTCDAMD